VKVVVSALAVLATGATACVQSPAPPSAAPAPAPAVAPAPATAPPTVMAPSLIPVGTRVGVGPTVPSKYDSEGRRDPFLSLVMRRPSANQPALNSIGGRPRSGLAAVPVADIVVRGITRAGTRMMAILEAPDRKSFAVKVQDRLLDGAIKSIDAGGVVFIEQDGEEIRKTLRPIGEVIR